MCIRSLVPRPKTMVIRLEARFVHTWNHVLTSKPGWYGLLKTLPVVLGKTHGHQYRVGKELPYKIMPARVPLLLQIACQSYLVATCMGSYKVHITYATGPHYSLDPIPFWQFEKGMQSRLDHTSLIPRPCGRRKVTWEWGYSHALQ